VAGVLTNSVLLLTAHYAMVHTGAAQIALVQTLNPLLTALFAWPLLGERLQPLQWLGLCLGAAGVVLVVGLAAMRSPVELNGLLLTAGGVVGQFIGNGLAGNLNFLGATLFMLIMGRIERVAEAR